MISGPLTPRFGAAGSLLLALLIVAVPRGAGAQEQEARRYAEAGDEAFRLGRYLVAAAAYEEAYQREQLPALVFSAAQAFRRQYFVDRDPARLERARDLYRLYLEQVPEGGRRDHAVTHLQTIDLLLARPAAPGGTAPEVPPEAAAPPSETQLMIVSHTRGARAGVDGEPAAAVPVIRTVAPGSHRVRVEADGFFEATQEWLAVEARLVVAGMELRPRPALVHVRAPTGAAISVDGEPVGVAPLRAPLVLAAGPHRVVATARGHLPFDRTLLLARAERVSVSAEMPESVQRKVAWSLLAGAGATLAAAGVTTGLAFAAEARASSLSDDVEGGVRNLSDAERARYERDLDRRDDLGTASVVLGASALALGVSWALAYLLDHPEPDQMGSGTR